MKSISYFIGASVLLLAIQCSPKKSETVTENETPTESDTTNHDHSEMTKEYISTFQFEKPEKIIIESYAKMSDQYDSTIVPKKAEINDEPTIARVIELTKALPDKGEIMKKMADGPMIEVRLIYSDKVLYFDYYGETVKTPDTSFYANPPKEQKQLYDLLSSVVK